MKNVEKALLVDLAADLESIAHRTTDIALSEDTMDLIGMSDHLRIIADQLELIHFRNTGKMHSRVAFKG